MRRLNSILIGIAIIFGFIYVFSLILAQRSESEAMERRRELINSVESVIDRSCLKASEDLERYARQPVIQQILLKQVTAEEIELNTNNGEGLFFVWDEEGKLLLKLGVSISLADTAPLPVRQRLLRTGRHSDRPILLAGSIKQMERGEKPIGRLALLRRLEEDDFAGLYAKESVVIRTLEGRMIFGLNGAEEEEEGEFYLLTDGLGEPAALLALPSVRRLPLRSASRLFGMIALSSFGLYLIGVVVQYFREPNRRTYHVGRG